jgi:hypothetical protein
MKFTDEEIKAMAQEAGLQLRLSTPAEWWCWEGSLERFATLVADAEAKRMHDEGMVTVGHMRERIAAEREACAVLCEDARASIWEYHPDEVKQAAKNACTNLAAKIRARTTP